MPAYLDCPGCSCLVAARDASCPFCGTALRSGHAPAWLALGFVAALGTLSISCNDKDDGDTVTNTVSDSNGPDSNGDVSDSSNPTVGVTYAGPDESSESDPGFSSSDGPPDPTTTNGPTNDPSNGEGATYAGPDETSSTDPNTTSTTTTEADSDGTDGDGETETGTSGDSTSEGSSSSTGSESSSSG